MKSPEKVLLLLEELQDSEDSELAEAIGLKGIPPALLRGGLAMLTDVLPDTPDELDAFLTQVADFTCSLRSDT